jgi:hypothetical protein
MCVQVPQLNHGIPTCCHVAILQTENSYFTESVGKLKEAATKKADESI